MSEYIITVDENDERWHYVEQQYTHFFGYPIAGEIVRCRDCKHSTADGTVCWNERFAHYEQIGDDHEWGDVPMDTEPDGFCKWGKRREP